MLPHPLTRTTSQEIQAIVAGRIPEDRFLDYKRDLPSGSDHDVKEFLADVSSFANSAGGLLIYGVEEERDAKKRPTGRPSQIVGTTASNVDAERLRLEQLIRSGISPPPSVEVHGVQMPDGSVVILVRVRESVRPPHMVTYKGTSRFYCRTAAAKRQMDVEDIRASVIGVERQGEELRRFRFDRLAKVAAGEAPVPVEGGAKLVLHLVPLSAFSGHPETIDLSVSLWADVVVKLLGSGTSPRMNFDGLLAPGPMYGDSHRAYVLVFRTGAIELVTREDVDVELDSGTFIIAGNIVRRIDVRLGSALKTLKSAGLDGPYAVLMSCLGVRGSWIYVHEHVPVNVVRWVAPSTAAPVDREDLHFQEIVFTDAEADLMRLMRPVFDALYQAGGLTRCPAYGADGSYLREGKW